MDIEANDAQRRQYYNTRQAAGQSTNLFPEIMITGQRPIVKAEQGKLVYDLPRLIGNLPVDNAYDAVKELPGVTDEWRVDVGRAGVNL